MEYILRILLIIETALVCYSTPTVSTENPDAERALKYFAAYSTGFSNVANAAAGVGTNGVDDIELNNDNPLFKEMLVNFQDMANLEPTGTVDKETLEKMEESRCGVQDPQSDPNAPGRYEVQSRWWSKKNQKTGLYVMTYKFSKRDTPKDVKFYSLRKAVALAMCSWELISNVRFRHISNNAKRNADVVISYEKRNHGDGYSFDGRGGTLGHAFYPEDGRVHLDLDELWYLATPKKEDRRKKDIYTAALHEFGHTIGLLHSKDRGALMAPFYRYRGTFGTFDMPNDEIAGVEDMYGKRINSHPLDERFSACREVKRKYKVNITRTAVGPTEETETAVLETLEPEKPCEDDPFHAKTHCPAWKARKLCQVDIFAETMHRRCKRTCGFCPASKRAEKVMSADDLGVASICDINSFDSIMTTYDQEDGFSALVFKEDYYFKLEVALLKGKYQTHSLLNSTEEISGFYRFDTNPRTINPGLFKIKTPNFLYKTSKADASVMVGDRYFTFEGDQMHIYKREIGGVMNFDTTYIVSEIFSGFDAAKVDAAHVEVNEEEDTVTFTLFSGCDMWQYKEYRDKGRGNLLFSPIHDKSGVNIVEWKGVAACYVDSVFEYRGVPYFLKGNTFWPATISEPEVTRDITYNFFRCWENEPLNIDIPSKGDLKSGENGVTGQHVASTFSILFVIAINQLITKILL